jgi:hypothetical protein
MTSHLRSTLESCRIFGVLLLVVATLTIPSVSRAAEIIPSILWTKSVDDNGGDAKMSGGLALRFPLPLLKLEGAISYRQDKFSSGGLEVRQWPVTASAWLSPFPMVYVGGGLGWYRTTYDYASTLPYKDTTSQNTGVHLGGGLTVPIGPKLGLDFNGRYVFMQRNGDNVQLPTTFNPDFWTTSLGLAIRF